MARKEKACLKTENRALCLPRQIAATPGTYRYLPGLPKYPHDLSCPGEKKNIVPSRSLLIYYELNPPSLQQINRKNSAVE